MVTLDGPVKELGNLVNKYEEVFELTLQYFEGKVDFVQTVRLKTKVKTNLSGSLEYMACNNSQCLPPATVPFSVILQ
jgi:Disulphide bond corrector protein DsbC